MIIKEGEPLVIDPYVADPHWGGYIVAYFFLGGIAAGSYAAASLARLFGDASDRDATRAAHYLAFPLVSLCGILLILDLNRPERFWHMLIASETFRPMFKWWSPMSVGSWGLSLFGGFSLVSFLKVMIDDGHLRISWLGRLLSPLNRSGVAIVFEVLGMLSAFFLGAYTGTLLSATNQPVWAQSDWISALFLASAGSSGVAAILVTNRLLLRFRNTEAEHRLERFDRFIAVFELILVLVFLLDLKGVGLRFVTRWPGVLLPAFVVPFGLLLPIGLGQWKGGRWTRFAPWLVLVGGFALRFAIVGAPQAFTGTH